MYSQTRNIILFLLLLSLSLVVTNAATAGLILEQESYMEDNPERKGKGQIYISDNKIKFVADNDDPVIIFDLNKNKLFIVDNKLKHYVESSPKKYVEVIQNNLALERKKLKKELANMPKDKRALQIKMLENKGVNINGDEKSKSWEYKNAGETREIAGLSSQKIDLYEDGKLIQRLWISNKMQEIDFDKLAKFYGEIQKISQAPNLGLENQNNFGKTLANIYKLGYPMETIDYNLPGNRVETILSIKQADLQDKDFKPPHNYRKTKI